MIVIMEREDKHIFIVILERRDTDTMIQVSGGDTDAMMGDTDTMIVIQERGDTNTMIVIQKRGDKDSYLGDGRHIYNDS